MRQSVLNGRHLFIYALDKLSLTPWTDCPIPSPTALTPLGNFAMSPITDKLLDQLQDEMREMARDLRSEAAASLNEHDDAAANQALAFNLDEIADSRPLLSRFAFLLRKHSTTHAALAELTGASIAA